MLKVRLYRQWINQLFYVNNWILLVFWIVIGSILRFTNLSAKSPWTDEFATMVFSLGNDFRTVPLNQLISLDTLLQPLQFNTNVSISNIISLLLEEDNHPPLYFILNHLWINLLSYLGIVRNIDIGIMRTLPAFLGILSIPGIYILSSISFRSRLAGQISAALMAVSPYGIYLAQEARHYTFAILFVIASLLCLIIAIKRIREDLIVPYWLVLVWSLVNSIGLSIHYFFCLTLISEIITLVFLARSQSQRKSLILQKINYYRIFLIIIGTSCTGLIWLLAIIPKGYGNDMISWIHPINNILYFISPPFQLLAVWIPMVSLLPVESSSIPIVILSGLILLLFFIYLVPYILREVKVGLKNKQFRLPFIIFIFFISIVISLFLIITYLAKLDLTRGARYSFTYFPAVIALLGGILAIPWQDNIQHQFLKTDPFFLLNRKIGFYIIWIMGLLGSITVLVNLGYQKYYRPEQFVNIFENTVSHHAVIVTTHKSLVQIGEMMGIGLELRNSQKLTNTSFLLVNEDKKYSSQETKTLQTIVENIKDPLEVWTVNFNDSIKLKNCDFDKKKYPHIDGYRYERYICN
ncbi:MAG: putative membrane protein [Candidatus Atelocyanobacterium thalassa isolate SIO64986]|uniref:Putative membrane protein n=1 Tax=Candidatus Atelocyanobacterium thalassa isolate SIO64986 TaxID=1527444 RepID=A0A086CH56_9CHRO|nr:MAG: putative membrane protein [Candidatus Atelocyanobacterium thalassa isolate SIO64986]